MLGDVLLITEKHHKAAEGIYKYVVDHKKDKMIIAISGESGSGKSELSHTLAKKLNKEAGILTKVIHIDNYYRIHPLERTQWRKENGIKNSVGYGEYDWDTIYQNIKDFKEDKSSKMPCVDLVTEQIDQLITDFKGIEALVIDGLYAIKTDDVDVRVFIDLTYHETKKAQAVRGKEPQNEYRWAVLEQEHQMVQALRPTAQLLVTPEFEVKEKK